MGFWDFLKREQGPSVAWYTPNVTHLGADEFSSMILGDLTPGQMWATQPHLRTVVSFLARNIAQLGLHTFERDGEDRRRDRESPFARTMRRPNPDQTAYDLIYSLVGDLSLCDRAYWLIVPDLEGSSGWMFRRLPPTWVTPIARDVFGAGAYEVTAPGGKTAKVSADDVLAFTGYHPSNPRKGSPTVESLKETLSEQIEAAKYRNQVWKRGGRVSSVLERPTDAPQWSPEAREAFREDWYSKFTGNGSRAGGTPILEDGMKLQRVDFSAREQEYVEAAKLSFATVAAAFHVNPTMVGILDNANYSNVREFRRMLYGDTLGPLIAQIEDRVNTFLLPRLGMDESRFYVEFNINEKLQGSFEEQAAVMSTLVGRPILTADEGRALFNRPALGGDAATLVTPLNVLVGGQASPRDSGSQNQGPKALRVPAKVGIKAAPQESHQEELGKALAAFFSRQGKAVLARIGAGRDWWDGERWDGELADDLHRLTHALSTIIGKAEAERLGYPDAFDPERTVDFLRAVAQRQASSINETTRQRVAAAIEDDDASPAEVFAEAETTRAEGIAGGLAGFVAGFGTVEAGKHIASSEGVEVRKQWHTGGNPRPAHAAINGQVVGIDEEFATGQMWAGGGGPDDIGCNCSVSLIID